VAVNFTPNTKFKNILKLSPYLSNLLKFQDGVKNDKKTEGSPNQAKCAKFSPYIGWSQSPSTTSSIPQYINVQ
jgi:hypothetical protein